MIYLYFNVVFTKTMISVPKPVKSSPNFIVADKDIMVAKME